MFKENDNMRPGPTPERVLAVCRLIGKGNYKFQDLFKLSELNAESKFEEESVRRSIEAAQELRLVEKKGEKYLLKIDAKSLNSAQAFRKVLNPIIFSNTGTTFFKMTEWFISHSELIQSINRFDDFAAVAAKNGMESISENDVLGWRFWIRYLGHAYQYNKTLIPNMYTRLRDALENVKPGTKMTCNQFLSWIKNNIPEAASSCTNEGLPLAVSNGLRSLNDAGVIELFSTMDAVKIKLYPMSGVALNDFSEIIVKEV